MFDNFEDGCLSIMIILMCLTFLLFVLILGDWFMHRHGLLVHDHYRTIATIEQSSEDP